jgi:hypothetical protein
LSFPLGSGVAALMLAAGAGVVVGAASPAGVFVDVSTPALQPVRRANAANDARNETRNFMDKFSKSMLHSSIC